MKAELVLVKNLALRCFGQSPTEICFIGQSYTEVMTINNMPLIWAKALRCTVLIFLQPKCVMLWFLGQKCTCVVIFATNMRICYDFCNNLQCFPSFWCPHFYQSLPIKNRTQRDFSAFEKNKGLWNTVDLPLWCFVYKILFFFTVHVNLVDIYN